MSKYVKKGKYYVWDIIFNHICYNLYNLKKVINFFCCVWLVNFDQCNHLNENINYYIQN